MPKRVQLPDGNVGEFPDSMSDKDIEGVLQKQFSSKPTHSVQAQPAPFSSGDIKRRVLTARDWIVNQLPAAGGVVGGLIGGASAIETGPGAIIPAAAGAAAGGGLGEDARQAITEKLHPEDRKMGALESGVRMAGQAGLQGLNEVGGRAAGKIAGKVLAPVAESASKKYPMLAKMLGFEEQTSPRAGERLTAAAATPQQAGKVLQDVGNTIGDIEQEMRKLPSKERTVDGFLKAVNSRKDAMNTEAGVAMLPIAGVKTVPLGVSQNIKNLIREYMDNTQVGRVDRKYLMKRATEFEKPWSYRELDQLRTDLASQTAKHQAKNPVAKYTAEKGDLDLQIDNAILDGLRDTVYPEMDRASGKPAGYWADLKGRQSSLIRLQEVLDKRVKDLKGTQAISEVSPRFSSENLSLSLHPGSWPRAGAYGLRQALAPKKVLKEANKQVRRAFPTVNSEPYEVLFSLGLRGAEAKGPAPKNPTDAWQGVQ